MAGTLTPTPFTERVCGLHMGFEVPGDIVQGQPPKAVGLGGFEDEGLGVWGLAA